MENWKNNIEFKIADSYVEPLMEKVEEEEGKKGNTGRKAGGSSIRHMDVEKVMHDEEEEEDSGDEGVQCFGEYQEDALNDDF